MKVRRNYIINWLTLLSKVKFKSKLKYIVSDCYVNSLISTIYFNYLEEVELLPNFINKIDFKKS